MFRCQRCGRVSLPGQASARFPVEIREKVYPLRTIVRRGKVTAIDKGGKGWEIAREIIVCKYCERHLLEERERAQVFQK